MSMMLELKDTYLDIKKKHSSELNLESFDIVKTVDDYRNYWRPKNVKILLLSESHDYINADNHSRIIKNKTIDKLKGHPYNYAKTVYCLGHGETKLSDLRGSAWQFWKLFASCVSRNSISEFDKVSVGKTQKFDKRLENKIRLLKKTSKTRYLVN